MRRLRARWRVAGIAAVTGLLAVVIPMGLATGTVTTGSTLPDIGVLRLHLGAQDYFRLDPSDGSGGYVTGTGTNVQTIGVSGKCAVSPTSGSLVALSSTPTPNTFPGTFADSLGVGGKGTDGSGQPCGRIDAGQVLTLKLSDAAPLSGKEVDYAEIDVEGKFDVTIQADLWLDGSFVMTETLPTGPASDSGPDSADGDNYRWRIPASGKTAFDEIRLHPASTTGTLSLEGGADGTHFCTVDDFAACGEFSLGQVLNTTDSLFHITDVSGVLDCGGTASEGGGTTPEADVTRGSNEGCVPIPYLLQTTQSEGTGTVFLGKDLTSQGDANFTMVITWQPEAIPTTADGTYGFALQRWTQIDFSTGPHDVQWCEGTAAAPSLPGTELWCLTNQSTVVVSTGFAQLTEGYFGAGDPKMTR